MNVFQSKEISKTSMKMTNITFISMLETIKRLAIFSNDIVKYYNRICEEILITQFSLELADEETENDNNIELLLKDFNKILNVEENVKKQDLSTIRKKEIIKFRKIINYNRCNNYNFMYYTICLPFFRCNI